ncbi:unnamed protein product [Somion occarium]|uniref:CS domain-containing protein n=1 Tax=Somion occarium TaxID=3059160 RepID=A0ABP1CPK0_9APHY
MSKHPEVLWAQRSSETDEKKNILYVTVNLPDIKPETLDYQLTPTHISLKAKSGNADKGLEEHEYAFEFDLFDEVAPEESLKSLTSRHFVLVLRKKEKKADFWPRITKEKVKFPWLKTDFSKWVDEDEQEEKAAEDDLGMAGMDGMGDMGGMGGGMGGMDFEQMMKSMGGAGGFEPSASGSSDAPGEDEDEDDDGPPPLEEAEPAKA